MAAAASRIFILTTVATVIVALTWWLLLSQRYSVRDALEGWSELVVYSCSMSETENTDPAIRKQWHRVKILRNPKVGTQFFFANGHTITTRWFNAETGSIGGSGGFRWTDEKGVEKAAVLSYSDIISERGTYEIWADIGNWKGLPRYLNDDVYVSNWADVSLYCTLDGE